MTLPDHLAYALLEADQEGVIRRRIAEEPAAHECRVRTADCWGGTRAGIKGSGLALELIYPIRINRLFLFVGTGGLPSHVGGEALKRWG